MEPPREEAAIPIEFSEKECLSGGLKFTKKVFFVEQKLPFIPKKRHAFLETTILGPIYWNPKPPLHKEALLLLGFLSGAGAPPHLLSVAKPPVRHPAR